MTQEQMQNEIARLNKKIEIEMNEVKRIAKCLLENDNYYSVAFQFPSRMLLQCEVNIKEYITRRDTLKEFVGE